METAAQSDADSGPLMCCLGDVACCYYVLFKARYAVMSLAAMVLFSSLVVSFLLNSMPYLIGPHLT